MIPAGKGVSAPLAPIGVEVDHGTSGGQPCVTGDDAGGLLILFRLGREGIRDVLEPASRGKPVTRSGNGRLQPSGPWGACFEAALKICPPLSQRLGILRYFGICEPLGSIGHHPTQRC